MKTIVHIFCLTPSFFKRSGIANKLAICTFLILSALASHAQEIKMYSGINLVLNGSIYLVVNNTAFKNNGSFAAGNSTVVFTGNVDTTLAYVSGSSNTRFNNLTLAKTAYGIALKSPAGVKNVLTVTTGYLYADSNLTLLSDAVNTARVATVPSGANIFGKATVERYIPSRRAWRLMTGPVTGGSSIFSCWQNKGVYALGRGMFVTNPGGVNGFDNGNASSLKIYDVARQLLVPITATNGSISATNNGSADNTGYFVFIRGDRDPNNLTPPNTNITTLSAIGRLQVGTQVFTASAITGGFTLIGNPYASPIDFNLVSRVNLLKRFYAWDPTLNAQGGYVTLDDLDNDGNFTKSVSFSSQTKEIQSSQAFFVETNTNGAASLTITESAKSVTNNTPVFRPIAGTGTLGISGNIRTNLYLLNADNSVGLADGALVEFGAGFHDNITNEDALKFTNINESIALMRYGTALAIERRPDLTTTDTLFFKLWRTVKRRYQLKLAPENIYRQGMLALFEDSYLATSTPLDLLDTTTINFTIDGNSASAADNRFRIIFKSLTVLPVSFSSVKAYHVNDKIKVEWQVQEEVNIIKYELEKSANGMDFTYLNTTGINTTGTYSWIDPTPFTGKNFYRI
ncbi:MAG: hypothetical protein ABIS01_07560, partial [Ferruginibacter sp.]